MQKTNYFKKTFFFVFVFVLTYRIVFQLFEDTEAFTIQLIIKAIAIAFFSAITMGVINHFLKFEFSKKINHN